MTDTSEAIYNAVEDLVNARELNEIITLQESMLGKFEKTNEMLRTASELSINRYKILSSEILNHAKSIIVIKKELDSIFKRVSAIKRLFISNFPEDMDRLSSHFNSLSSDNEDTVNDFFLPQVSSVPTSSKMETICEQTNSD